MTHRQEFSSVQLNGAGVEEVNKLRSEFSHLLDCIEHSVGAQSAGPGNRELALVRTKLEEASFYAIKATSLQTRYQVIP